ncbi:MAG: rhamnosidase, partial [Chthoniobacterales bacterium]|nr:rhamnosidase [Chthoniobacterales bacterium]
AGEAFRTKFLAADGTIQESSQTGFALAFSIDLIPDELRAKATEQFVKSIEQKDWHLATGFVGTQRLLPALTAAGRSDVAYRLLLQETFPSWLFQVKLGATTMWERWDGWTPEKGFQDPGMNSFNHYAFGSVGQWMYGAVAGIETDTPGFKTFTIKPVIGEGLTHAEATYKSVRGEIKSGWKKEADGTLKFDITVPPNTSAMVFIPAESPQVVTEGGEPMVDRPGVQFIDREGACAVYKVASGSYHFASKP